ncbi:MAG: histidine kinase N-terminal 7TM domain-containing protein [Patescibacteria group bacterium]|jgi:hypothetical protein
MNTTDILSWFNIVVAAAELYFAFYMLLTRVRSKVSVFYFLFSLGVAGWVYSIGGFYLFENPGVERFHLNLAYISASLIMSALFLFAMVFPFQKRRLGLEHYALAILPFLAFAVASFAHQILTGYIKDPTEYFLGPLYTPYTIYIVGYYLIAMALLVEKYRMSDGIHRWQLKNLILSLLFAGVMGVTFNLLIQFWGIAYLNHVGTLASVIWFSTTLYIVMKR